MVRDELSVMSAFLAVADERSFTKAAKRLGVTQSALSHAIRGLEEQVGVRLLARTTRSVAPTEAGEQLLAELRPALTGIRGALDRIGGLRDTPRGRLRLLIPRLAAMTVLGPHLGRFARNYPDVVLDVSTDETRLDLVAGGFDAGVQYGEFIHKDMVAVRVSSDHRPAIVGSPAYLADHPMPHSPHDLLHHPCINYRHGSGGDLPVGVGQARSISGRRGERTADHKRCWPSDPSRARRCRSRVHVRRTSAAAPSKWRLGASARGVVLRSLDSSWTYPSRKQQPAALTALIETLRIDTLASAT